MVPRVASSRCDEPRTDGPGFRMFAAWVARQARGGTGLVEPRRQTQLVARVDMWGDCRRWPRSPSTLLRLRPRTTPSGARGMQGVRGGRSLAAVFSCTVGVATLIAPHPSPVGFATPSVRDG